MTTCGWHVISSYFYLSIFPVSNSIFLKLVQLCINEPRSCKKDDHTHLCILPLKFYTLNPFLANVVPFLYPLKHHKTLFQQPRPQRIFSL